MRAVIIGFICVLFSAMLSQAQTLQFSQVILVNNIQQAVPAGKVWKVENYQQSDVPYGNNFNGTNCNSESNLSPYIINGQPYYDLQGVAYGSATLFFIPKNGLPLWLPSGTTVRTACANDFLSIIEFNIIP